MCELETLQGGFVPAGHNLALSLERYLDFRERSGRGNNRQDYIAWRVEQGAAQGAAAAEWYPLGENQCGFGQLPIDDLRAVTEEPEGLRASLLLHRTVPENIADACQTVKSAYVVGVMRKEGLSNSEIVHECVTRGWAGGDNAARALLNVGQSFLRHFRLVDENDELNGRFALLFSC